jgi:hypothetical protein
MRTLVFVTPQTTNLLAIYPLQLLEILVFVRTVSWWGDDITGIT